MKELFPAAAISFMLHLMVFSLLSLSLGGKPGHLYQRGPIFVRILEPSGGIKKSPPVKAKTGPKIEPQVQREEKLQGTEAITEPPVEEEKLPEKGKTSPVEVKKDLHSGPGTPSGEPFPGRQNEGEGVSGKKALPEGLSIKQLLPGDLIAKAARRPIEEEREGPSQDSITFSTKDLKYEPYLMRLKERIEAIWVYPREAIERGIYGDLIIDFGIKKDGSLAYARVVRTSGFEVLDEAALRALKNGQPYWPLPESWEEEVLPIRGHFIYTLGGGYYIR